MESWWTFAAIGLLGGIAAGLFGVGGGIVIVPALIYWAGFTCKNLDYICRTCQSKLESSRIVVAVSLRPETEYSLL